MALLWQNNQDLSLTRLFCIIRPSSFFGGKQGVVHVLIEGPKSWYGGQEDKHMCKGVVFTFLKPVRHRASFLYCFAKQNVEILLTTLFLFARSFGYVSRSNKT